MARVSRTRFSATIITLALVGCAAAPPPLLPLPLTQQQVVELREQEIQKTVTAAYRAGDDGLIVDMKLHLAWCTHDAQEIVDQQQRTSAIQQCRADWPQPVPGQKRPFTTSR